jgi:DNA-binding transcriptional regulator YiaG
MTAMGDYAAGIRAARKDLGLSAEAFARAIGVADGRLIRRWEAGDREPYSTAMTVIDALREVAGMREWLLARAQRKGD